MGKLKRKRKKAMMQMRRRNRRFSAEGGNRSKAKFGNRDNRAGKEVFSVRMVVTHHIQIMYQVMSTSIMYQVMIQIMYQVIIVLNNTERAWKDYRRWLVMMMMIVKTNLRTLKGFADRGYHLIHKDNLISAFGAVHRAAGCDGKLEILELVKHVKGFDGCIELSCSKWGLSHKMYSSDPSVDKPDVRHERKNSRMVMFAIKSGNDGALFKLSVQILGLRCRFSKSAWSSHKMSFSERYEIFERSNDLGLQ